MKEKRQKYESPVIEVRPGVRTHKFFVINLTTGQTMSDEGGRILVYNTRERATMVADMRDMRKGGFMVAGMGDESWARFQENEKYVVIE